MKHYGFVLCLFLAGCALQDGGGPLVLEFPPLPAAWTDLLGPPRWLVRYHAEGAGEGYVESDGAAELPLSPSVVSPVLAWPYWPGLEPGDFRPAGGILPFDAHPSAGASDRMVLSWQGGVDAWFYLALDALGSGDLRQGRNFNWPNFRALFSDPAVPQEVRNDPWRVDWEAVAAQTVGSGFRKQLLKAGETSRLRIPVYPGPWIAPSPFAPPLLFNDGTGVFEVQDGFEVQAWYSAVGILHCAGTSWLLLPWE